MGLEIIQKLKKEKGLTTEMLSQLSGVPQGTLNKILNGETKDPKLETLKSIARVLGCTLDDFNDDPETKSQFSSEEIQLIEKYRRLDDRGKTVTKALIDKQLELFDVENGKIPSTWPPKPERYKFDKEQFEKTISGNDVSIAARNSKP